jgi:hypothetical protein
MRRINWREVCKFVAGATFVGTIANAYLWVCNIPLPFFGYTISPGLFGARAVVSLLLFVICVYVAYLRPPAAATAT